jgi:hypothetical protein
MMTESKYPAYPVLAMLAPEGLDRLRKRGRFVRPPSSEEAMRDLEDLAAPVAQSECPVALRTRPFGLESARPLFKKGGK